MATAFQVHPFPRIYKVITAQGPQLRPVMVNICHCLENVPDINRGQWGSTVGVHSSQWVGGPQTRVGRDVKAVQRYFLPPLPFGGLDLLKAFEF